VRTFIPAGIPRAGVSSLVVMLGVSLGWACGSSPTSPSTNSPLSPGPAPAPAGPAAIPFRVSGVVTNDDGVPLDGATVTLFYQPDLAAPQSGTAKTTADGRYELQLDARQPGNVNAVVRVVAANQYGPFEQFVRVADSAERNFRLRRIQTITSGQSATIKIDSDSSLCWSLGIGGRCEWLRVQTPTGYTCTVDVKAVGNGGVLPTLSADVGYRVVGQGAISFQMALTDFPCSSRIIDVAISIPDGTAPQQYELTVSSRYEE